MTNTRLLSDGSKLIPLSMLAAILSCLMMGSAFAASTKEAAQPSIDIFKCTSSDTSTSTVYSDTPCDDAPPVMTLRANMNVVKANAPKPPPPVKKVANTRPTAPAKASEDGPRAMMTDPKADKNHQSARCHNLEKRLDQYALRQQGRNATARQRALTDEQIKRIEKQLQENQCQ